MQVTVNVPETLPQDIVQQLLKQFERMLQKEAEKWRASAKPVSKWTKIAKEAHKESPLEGLSAHILRCSQKIRGYSEFKHDQVQSKIQS